MNKIFGSLVATAVAGTLTGGVAKAADGWCKSGCSTPEHKVAGAKNTCNGQMACKGVTEAACKKAKGTWTTEKKPG